MSEDTRALACVTCFPAPGAPGADLDRREVNEIAIVRTYETLYIIDPNLSDEQIQAIIDKYKNVVTGFGGEVIVADRWDRRKLAYDIKNYRDGIYIMMYFKAPSTSIKELDRVMRISEDVLRHQTVLEESNQAEIARERAARPQPKPIEPPPPAPVVEPAKEEVSVTEEVPAKETAPEVAETEAPAEKAAEAPAEAPAAEETPAE